MEMRIQGINIKKITTTFELKLTRYLKKVYESEGLHDSKM
jgi:hypothetical protein